MNDHLNYVAFPDCDDNYEPRCPCVLLLDVSGSMRNEGRIHALNEGIRVFRDNLICDTLVSTRVEVCVMAFNNKVKLIQDYVTADTFSPPTLVAREKTMMADAIYEAIKRLRQRQEFYRQQGIECFRPWMIMVTDGRPHSGWNSSKMQEVADIIAELEENKRLVFQAVGVAEADMSGLQWLSIRKPIMLKGLNFAGLFEWLSDSLAAQSQSSPSDYYEAVEPSEDVASHDWEPSTHAVSSDDLDSGYDWEHNYDELDDEGQVAYDD